MGWLFLCLWCLLGMSGDTHGLKAVSVKEGESVTLHTDREMRNNDVVVWKFGPEDSLLVDINVADKTFSVNGESDQRFVGRLKVDPQTACLTITNTRVEHAGRYQLQTNSMKRFFLLTVTVTDAISRNNEVKSVSVMEGNSVTLHTDTETRSTDLMEWRFGHYLIAEMKEVGNIAVYDYVLEGRFKDRMQVVAETGSLNFTNATFEHSGVYQLHTNHTNKIFTLSVYAPLPVPIIFSYCPPSSSASKCVLLCSAVNVGDVTLSWYRGYSLLSSITVFDLSIALSLPLEVDYQDQNRYSCVLNNSFTEQTQHLDISKHCHVCSGSVHGCDNVQAVIRLVVTALVGVAAVAAAVVLRYDIRSRRAEEKRASLKQSSRSLI